MPHTNDENELAYIFRLSRVLVPFSIFKTDPIISSGVCKIPTKYKGEYIPCKNSLQSLGWWQR
jgi:hypothetical protein